MASVEFKLKEIVQEATAKLVETFPGAQEYLLTLCDEQLESKLTPSEVTVIAARLLEKAGFLEGAP